MSAQRIPAPPGKTFLPYQEKGIRYCLGGKGTILADEMGLGKTVQAIGVINAMQAQQPEVPLDVLIVAPAGLVLNWQRELQSWLWPRLPNITTVSYHGANHHAENPKLWDLLIVDEAQYIKNQQAQRSMAVKTIAQQAKRVLLLTGTPIENGRPIELWPLLQIAAPQTWDPPAMRAGRLSPELKKSHPGEGPAFWAYAKRYCGLKKVTYGHPSGKDALGRRRRSKSAWDFSGATNLEELATRLRHSCMVRRLKSDVLGELPPKRRQIIPVPSYTKDDDLLPELSEATYEQDLKRFRAMKVQFEDWSKRRHEQALAKVEFVAKHVDDLLDNTAKVIVFCHHTDVASKLNAALFGHSPAMIVGSTTMKDREEAVYRFQNESECHVFIGTIGAAGTGITLTAANVVVFAELDPTPGRMSQAEDRAHRIGQKDFVLVQHLVSDGSLCARIAKILVKKQENIRVALGDQYQDWPEERTEQ